MTGTLWKGRELPIISTQAFASAAVEILDGLERDGSETPQGDSWTVKVPTDLVKLRE